MLNLRNLRRIKRNANNKNYTRLLQIDLFVFVIRIALVIRFVLFYVLICTLWDFARWAELEFGQLTE